MHFDNVKMIKNVTIATTDYYMMRMLLSHTQGLLRGLKTCASLKSDSPLKLNLNCFRTFLLRFIV